MSTKKSEDGDPPSIRAMVRELVELGIAAVRGSPSFRTLSDAWRGGGGDNDAPSKPPAAASAPESPDLGLDRSTMVEALVVDGQICLMLPPNETVFGFMACEIWTPPGKEVDGCDLQVHVADAMDTLDTPATVCVPLIKKKLDRTLDKSVGHLCRLKHPILIGSQDHVCLRYVENLPHGSKIIGYALGAIAPSRMGGGVRFELHDRSGPRDASS